MAQPSELLILLMGVAVVHTATGHMSSFNRCQLSRELQRYNFPRNLIAKWVCLIEHVSGSVTNIVTHHNETHASYGLFQISNNEWCHRGHERQKEAQCNMKCNDLLNEDLNDDVRCAKRIFDRVGFKAWPSFSAHCKKKTLPDLAGCR